MREEAVSRLINNLYVLKGRIQETNIKIWALENVIQDLKGPHYERYRQLVLGYQSGSTLETAFPLEDIEGLRKALLQD